MRRSSMLLPSDSSSWEISQKSSMESAMEMGAGDAGSWTLMSCSIFYEFGNGEMDCQLGGSRGILEFNPFIYYTLL